MNESKIVKKIDEKILMKKIIIFLFLILLYSCSQKSQSKSGFKITLGNVVASADGGAYVNFIDVKNSAFNIIKLDAESSATVNFGTYNLIVVTFQGPVLNSGAMLCGSIMGANITTPSTTFNLNVSSAECSLPRYTPTILEITKGKTSTWDNSHFDVDKWEP